MTSRQVELPHLLPCKGCGVPNGRNAEQCWSCGAGLSSRFGARAFSPPSGGVATDKSGPERSSGRLAIRPLTVAFAVVLALGALAASWLPAADGSARTQAASEALAPVQASALAVPATSTRLPARGEAPSASAPPGREESIGATPTDRREVARALGLIDDGPGAPEPAAERSCREVDGTLGLCIAQPVAAERK